MMLTRRFALVVLTLAVGCGLPSPSDQSARQETGPSRAGVLLSAEDGMRIVRSSGRPDHLNGQGRDRTEKTDVVIASSAADPLPTPTTTETVDAAPPVTTPPSTTGRSTTPPATTVAPVTTTVAPVTTTVAPVADGAAGGAFVAAINALRGGVGVQPLGRSADLDARAQAWTENMAASGDIGHSSIVGDLVAGSWSIAGENVGYGPSVDSVFTALVASSGHYSNMVNASFTMVGVGVVVDGNGLVWTTHLFAG